MTQIAYPQAETEPATESHLYTDHQLAPTDLIETFREEQTEALDEQQGETLKDENGVIDYRHYLNKAHHLRSGFWWGLFKQILSKDGKDTEVLK